MVLVQGPLVWFPVSCSSTAASPPASLVAAIYLLDVHRLPHREPPHWWQRFGLSPVKEDRESQARVGTATFKRQLPTLGKSQQKTDGPVLQGQQGSRTEERSSFCDHVENLYHCIVFPFLYRSVTSEVWTVDEGAGGCQERGETVRTNRL